MLCTQPYRCNVRVGRDHHRNLCHDAICNAEVLLRRGLVCLECALSLFIRTLDIAIWFIFLLNSSTTTTQLHSCGLWLVIPAAANANVQSDLNKQVGLWWHWWEWGIWPPVKATSHSPRMWLVCVVVRNGMEASSLQTSIILCNHKRQH